MHIGTVILDHRLRLAELALTGLRREVKTDQHAKSSIVMP
jgi:hypothetical protein